MDHIYNSHKVRIAVVLVEKRVYKIETSENHILMNPQIQAVLSASVSSFSQHWAVSSCFLFKHSPSLQGFNKVSLHCCFIVYKMLLEHNIVSGVRRT